MKRNCMVPSFLIMLSSIVLITYSINTREDLDIRKVAQEATDEETTEETATLASETNDTASPQSTTLQVYLPIFILSGIIVACLGSILWGVMKKK